jgi:vacuolar-type H+-ATPase subunit I/STV1
VSQIESTKIGSAVSYVLGDDSFATITKAVSTYILNTYGINFDPELLFIIPFALTFLLGLFQLISCWFTYVAMGLKPLSGKGGWLKALTFLFVMIGYGLPVLNLFPLVYLWTITVWAYPK